MKLSNTVRWAFLAPITVVATFAAYSMLVLLWNIQGAVNIVSTDFLDVALAAGSISAFAAAAGVMTGERMVPDYSHISASISAGLLILFALIALTLKFTNSASMDIGRLWVVISSIGFIAGATATAFFAFHRGPRNRLA